MSETPLTILIAVGMLVAGWMFKVWLDSTGNKRAEQQKAFDKIAARLEKLENDSAETKFQVKPMWEKVQKQLSDDLHHPHADSKEMDTLLEQLQDLSIDEAGRVRLKELLVHRVDDPNTPESERQSAEIFAIVMDKVLVEADTATNDLVNVEKVGEAVKPAEGGETQRRGRVG